MRTVAVNVLAKTEVELLTASGWGKFGVFSCAC